MYGFRKFWTIHVWNNHTLHYIQSRPYTTCFIITYTLHTLKSFNNTIHTKLTIQYMFAIYPKKFCASIEIIIYCRYYQVYILVLEIVKYSLNINNFDLTSSLLKFNQFKCNWTIIIKICYLHTFAAVYLFYWLRKSGGTYNIINEFYTKRSCDIDSIG